ncbi:MAG: SIS domain-containing protein [Defluviitaleaceae bacterium]|nr:SIS domain-containing protein [Defluviitaleaceae bacterium]
MFLGISDERIAERGGKNTAREISQQPETLRELYAYMLEREDEINGFMTKLGGDCPVIFTGAGSSEFVGQAVCFAVRNSYPSAEAVSTTNIVASPETYLRRDKKILLVSFSRSGDSPESAACIDLANQICENIFHIIITCNKNGELYTRFNHAENVLALLMPEETNDIGFAMTSSVTSMIAAAYLALCKKNFSDFRDDIGSVCAAMESFLAGEHPFMHELAQSGPERIAFLGSNGLRATATESALKVMELTNGQTATLPDSAMAFRHGPKTFLNRAGAKTAVIILFTDDEHTCLYDMDMLKELRGENRENIIAVSNKPGAGLTEYSSTHLLMETKTPLSNDIFLSILYLVFTQSLAFMLSYYQGYNTDSPVESGTLTRVVSGVTIHPYSR